MRNKITFLAFLAVFQVANLFAQEITVTGKVTSAKDGMTLPGVNVIVKGTSNGAVTDMDGQYSLEVS
ncbi:MAG: carboxypeptidase-like regulatory domain-containing protein, partial [Salegentibacter sp.]